MIGEKLESQQPPSGFGITPTQEVPQSAGVYKEAERQEITRFGKLFHQTGRLQAADSYLWISPFVRQVIRLFEITGLVLRLRVHVIA